MSSPRRAWTPKHSQPATKPESQTAKANATPRVGQGTRKRSPYQRAFDHVTRQKYPGQAPSYNVGRTRRMA